MYISISSHIHKKRLKPSNVITLGSHIIFLMAVPLREAPAIKVKKYFFLCFYILVPFKKKYIYISLKTTYLHMEISGYQTLLVGISYNICQQIWLFTVNEKKL